MVSRFLNCALILVLLSSCDFTPRLYKDLIKAQDLISSQNYNEAVVIFNRVLEKNPNDDVKVKIYYQLGEIYSLHLQDNISAIKNLKNIRSLTQDPLWIVKTEEKMGDINFSYLKNYKEALENYLTLESFIPKLKRFDFYNYRHALCLFNLNRHDDAKKLFEKIAEDQQHDFYDEALYQIGLINFEDKNWKRAISYWSEYLRVSSDHQLKVQVRFLIANSYEMLEDLKKAYNFYYSILGDYPNTEVIKNRLNAIYARKVARKR